MIKKPNKILSGAFFLGLGAFLSKLLGAIYRIPLTNLLGSTGLGLYQLVFPVYTVLLDFSGAGVPSALYRIISSADENDRQKSDVVRKPESGNLPTGTTYPFAKAAIHRLVQGLIFDI